MRLRTFLAHLVVCWAWVPPSLHHRTPHAVRKPLNAENDYLASLAKAPPKRGPGRLRRAWRRLRGAPAAYIGGGSTTPLHFDALENLLVVVRGRKDVTLWHPQHSALLYPRDDGAAAIFSRADIYHPDFDAFPLLRDALPLGLRAELLSCMPASRLCLVLVLLLGHRRRERRRRRRRWRAVAHALPPAATPRR